MSQAELKSELTIIWAEEKADLKARLDLLEAQTRTIELRLSYVESDVKAIFVHLRVTPVHPPVPAES